MPGWNLPPGVTEDDIDRAMGGDEPRCWACHDETDDLEGMIVRGRVRGMCGSCAAGYEDAAQARRDDREWQ